MKSKFGQEEIVGFALIIIMVAVILLVFLGFSLKKPPKEPIESYEVESFIQAFLQYTSDCRDAGNLEYLSIRKLIFDCNNNKMCLDETPACEVLESTLTEITEESWKVEEDRPIQGYNLTITVNGEDLLFFEKGNITNNYRGSMQDFVKSGSSFDISFTAYY